jgi:hypothetical protein
MNAVIIRTASLPSVHPAFEEDMAGTAR